MSDKITDGQVFRCAKCYCRWELWPNGTWSVRPGFLAGRCCDNVPASVFLERMLPVGSAHADPAENAQGESAGPAAAVIRQPERTSASSAQPEGERGVTPAMDAWLESEAKLWNRCEDLLGIPILAESGSADLRDRILSLADDARALRIELSAIAEIAMRNGTWAPGEPLAAVKFLAERCERAEAAGKHWHDHEGELRRRAVAAERERDALKAENERLRADAERMDYAHRLSFEPYLSEGEWCIQHNGKLFRAPTLRDAIDSARKGDES